MDNETHHVLGEALCQRDVMTLLQEMAHGKSVLIGIAAGETLIGHVEEDIVTLRLDRITDLPPLVVRRIDSSRVVGAGVQQEDAAAGGTLHVLEHALKVQADRLRVVVAVLLHLEARIGEHGVVVGPARRRDVDRLGAGEEALHEGTSDAQSARAGDGLRDGHAVLLQGN